MATVHDHVQKFRAAHRLASDIMATAHRGLPSEDHIHHLATAIFVHGIKASGAETKTANHAGTNQDNENLLDSAYEVPGEKSGH
jgi:hypothetical protein